MFPDQDEANYDIAMMYLDANKWKDAFPFLLKAANNNHVKAVSELISTYQMEVNLRSNSNFIKEFKSWLQDHKEILDVSDVVARKGATYYFLGCISNFPDKYFHLSKKNDFILGKYKHALTYYKCCKYAVALFNYRLCTQDRYFDDLPRQIRGYIYNDAALCGWFRDDFINFAYFNKLARDEELPIAFQNYGNAYFVGRLICSKPDYNWAAYWYKLALDKYNEADTVKDDRDFENIKYCAMKLEKCKRLS